MRRKKPKSPKCKPMTHEEWEALAAAIPPLPAELRGSPSPADAEFWAWRKARKAAAAEEAFQREDEATQR